MVFLFTIAMSTLVALMPIRSAAESEGLSLFGVSAEARPNTTDQSDTSGTVVVLSDELSQWLPPCCIWEVTIIATGPHPVVVPVCCADCPEPGQELCCDWFGWADWEVTCTLIARDPDPCWLNNCLIMHGFFTFPVDPNCQATCVHCLWPYNGQEFWWWAYCE